MEAREPVYPPALDQLLDYRARLLARLEAQPAEFAAVVGGMPADEWHTRRDVGGRTIHLAAAHVRDLEAQAYLPRIRRILAEDRPELTPFAHHDWSAADYEPSEPMTAILESWSRARTELLALVRPLDSAGWSRAGFHPPSGNRTLQWWVERAHGHGRGHLEALRGAGQAEGV
jgi:hypothetical protein